ncbi:COG1470 family protein [Streptomyces sparsogenes]|uniref:COG1470 family protein n=1 Tax=Streptomyces sparsogenes TaxID=67365 RepID=UPI00340AA146
MPSRPRLRVARPAAVAPALAAALLTAPALPTAPAAAAGPDWTARPAAGGADGPGADGRPYFYLEGGPGSALRDRLSIVNRGDRPRTVRLRPAAPSTGPDAPSAARGSGAWIALATERVTVPARTRADVPFTLTVPPDAPPGDHPGALVVTGGGREVRVRVHLRVSGPVLAALSVEDVKVVKAGRGAAIHYALVNRGNTVLAPRLAVRADGLFGEVLRRDARPLHVELAPGRRVRLTEKWPGAPTLDSVDVTLTATAAGGAHAAASAGYTPVPRGALAGAAAVALGLVGGAGAWLWRRRRGRRRARDGEAAEAPAREEREAREAREPAGTGSGART